MDESTAIYTLVSLLVSKDETRIFGMFWVRERRSKPPVRKKRSGWSLNVLQNFQCLKTRDKNGSAVSWVPVVLWAPNPSPLPSWDTSGASNHRCLDHPTSRTRKVRLKERVPNRALLGGAPKKRKSKEKKKKKEKKEKKRLFPGHVSWGFLRMPRLPASGGCLVSGAE